jgi:hypothetical protein
VIIQPVLPIKYRFHGTSSNCSRTKSPPADIMLPL